MKTKMMIGALVAGTMLWAGAARADLTFETNLTMSVNQVVPDSDLNGLVMTTNLTMPGSISSVTVGLNISGGYNGDLYAFLVGPNGGFAVLLNRVGVVNNATASGYGNAGFNVTFSDAAANGNIHYYQNVAGFDIASGTVLWQPDGANIFPLSPPLAFPAAGQTAMLSSFSGTDPNGQWELFLADVSPGSQSTLVGWSLDIQTVPEPSILALSGLGLAGVVLRIRRRK